MSTANLNKFQNFFYDYGRFHYNKINVWIHIICVPLIVYTLGRMIGYLGTNYLDLKLNPIYPLLAVLTCLYLYVDFVSGLLTIIQHVSLLYFFSDVDFSIGSLSSIQVIILVHVVSWILQFFGHGVYEKRKPALMDNIFLMFSAPVFVNIELMFMFLGYRGKEIEETMIYIRKDIEKYRNSFEKKK
jgi:uncharacterized membrane protein YGL010W